MKPHNNMTMGPVFNVGRKASVSNRGLPWNWVRKWLLEPIKRWHASMELRRKISELDDHLLRDAGLHETTYAAECKMRREQRILYPMF